MRKLALGMVAMAIAATAAPGAAAEEAEVRLDEFVVDNDAWCEVADQWREQLVATHEPYSWAPMEFEPSNAQLAKLGLPSKEILTSRRYPQPTLVTQDGRFYDVSTEELAAAARESAAQSAVGPTLTTYAGAGCLGIRPGMWVLLISGNSIGWCSAAHVYGTPGAYDISTAGHCGKTGATATAIAAFGNRGDATGVVLLDFGKFATSHDGGLGNDWALIDILPQYQSLVSPTMCFWGGPRGMYTKTGDLAALNVPRRGLPTVTVNPDPLLAQTIVHYGHGTGVGAGGTPRAGEAISWRATHFMFFGAISPGDSGSGANTLAGDTVGANMEAAGIMTHLWIDPLMRSGLGIMGGTRATQVSGNLANGQIVPYPAPAPGLP
jgi:hypothetical protein